MGPWTCGNLSFIESPILDPSQHRPGVQDSALVSQPGDLLNLHMSWQLWRLMGKNTFVVDLTMDVNNSNVV
ncbi:hypothetical protein NPIL_578981 [Nephila pilipes]|uniref:Uncharacterized protein n=1 Tax=Nephila pilipes TaxID=299642 RepID=A0A8X6PB39_NEPPI|nr:hypothetical protein NPIL_578981 [Nephila pilipes]